jgi:hypothetical protein
LHGRIFPLFEIPSIALFLLLVLDVAESPAWSFSGAVFNAQVISALDLRWIFSHYFGFLYLILGVVAILFLISWLPRYLWPANKPPHDWPPCPAMGDESSAIT